MNKVRVGVLASGRGSNLDALIAAAKAPDYPAQIVLVISNNPDAGALAKAQDAGIATVVVDHRPYKGDREAHERAIDAALKAADVELVALAGYMRVLTPVLVDAWAGRMLNIHPSLLPDHPGLDTHQRAIDAGDIEHGCTVHWVTLGVDEGPIMGQARVHVLPDDSEQSLAARVLAEEHKLYPACLGQAAARLRAAGKAS